MAKLILGRKAKLKRCFKYSPSGELGPADVSQICWHMMFHNVPKCQTISHPTPQCFIMSRNISDYLTMSYNISECVPQCGFNILSAKIWSLHICLPNMLTHTGGQGLPDQRKQYVCPQKHGFPLFNAYFSIHFAEQGCFACVELLRSEFFRMYRPQLLNGLLSMCTV